MYTYESSEQGDLSFQQGDIVMVTRKEGDWWTGTVGGKTGVFPSNYVKPRDSAMEVRALFFLQWSGLDQKLTVFPFLSSVSGTCRQDRKSREEARYCSSTKAWTFRMFMKTGSCEDIFMQSIDLGTHQSRCSCLFFQRLLRWSPPTLQQGQSSWHWLRDSWSSLGRRIQGVGGRVSCR